MYANVTLGVMNSKVIDIYLYFIIPSLPLITLLMRIGNTIPVTLTVTDAAGNNDSEVANVTITDYNATSCWGCEAAAAAGKCWSSKNGAKTTTNVY